MLHDRSDTMDKDRFFKFFDEGVYEHTSGEVDAPTGWFGLLVIDRHQRDEYGKDTGDIVPEVADGLYLVVINDQGLVWAYQHESGDDEKLYEQFRSLQIDYSRWCEDDQ